MKAAIISSHSSRDITIAPSFLLFRLTRRRKLPSFTALPTYCQIFCDTDKADKYD